MRGIAKHTLILMMIITFLALFTTYIAGADEGTKPVAGAGKALHFDGVNDYLDLPLSVGANVLPLTMEAWVSPEVGNEQTVNNIISSDKASHYGHGFSVNLFDGGSKLIVEYHDGFKEIPFSFSAGQWYHIAVVYTSGNYKAYVNGNLVDNHSYPQGSMDGVDFIRIGVHNHDAALPESYRYFKGFIDEVRVWNSERTQQDLHDNMYKPIAGDEEGLAGYWRFDEGSGTIAYDATSRNNDGALCNMNTADAWVVSNAWKIRSTDRNKPLVIYAGYDNDSDPVTISGTVEPLNGSLSFENERIKLTYSPNPGWSGTDNFEYKISDGSQSSSYAITVIVNPVYNVIYNSNGSTGGNVPTDGNSYEDGVIVTVLGNTENLEKSGYVFAGWNTEANGSGTNYAGGDTFSIGMEDIILSAQWLVTPIISNQPQDATVNEGTAANFTVVALALAPDEGMLTYQWQKSCDGTIWNDIPGETNASYTTEMLIKEDSGSQYRCKITNTKDGITAVVTSDVAILTIELPIAPIIQSAIAENAQVNISWNPVAGATGYKVFMSTASGTYGAAIDTVSSSVNSFNAAELTNGVKYYFVVRSLIGSNESASSNEVSATPKAPSPGAPFLESAHPGDGHVNISWRPVPGSIGYRVYASTTSGSYAELTNTVSGSVYSCDVIELINGTNYYFVVRATNSGGDSAYSNEVSAIPKTVPGAPTGVTAKVGNQKATVSFIAPTDNGGSAITGYMITSNPGNITATGTAASINVSGLRNGTSYTFTVKAINGVGYGEESIASNAVVPRDSSSHENTNHTGPTLADTVGTGIEILVNGKVETAGTIVKKKVGDKTVSTIIIDNKKVQKKLANEGSNAIVTIPFENDSDAIVGQLNGQTIKNMENSEAILEITTEDITYILPASEINIDNVRERIGGQVELKDITVNIKITAPLEETVRIVKDTANKSGYQVVVEPVEFEITCSNGSETVEVCKFNNYVERMVAIPENVDPQKITTAVVLNEDGTFSHVPTIITEIDGKYYAKISSLTNSTYSIIWNPIACKDAENHWAKEDINDMSSRLVIDGVGDGNFVPNGDMTRAEFAAVVVKALGLMRSEMGKEAFEDVTKDTRYYDALSIAYENGIIYGYGNAEFGPTDKTTREQAIVIINRAMNITDLEVEMKESEAENILAAFTDSGQVSVWVQDSMAACIKAGIVSGKGDKVLAPKDEITRAEAAAIVRRMLQKSGLI